MVFMQARMASELDFRWDDLRLFLAAHRTRSLTQAARRLGLNQSTTSRRLAAFEETLGARLFDRTPEGLVPTELAERLLAPAERAEAATHEAARVVAREEASLEGEVRVAVSEGMSYYVLAPAMARLREAHPGVRVTFVISVAMADLTRREADVALRFARPARGDLVGKRLWSGDYGVFGAPSLAARLGPGPHALAGLDFVGWDDQTQASIPEARWEAKAGVRCVVRASSITTRLALAQAGCGAIELARAWGRTLPGLVELDTEPVDMSVDVWLVTHRALREVPRVRVVWEFIEDALATLVG